MATRTLHLPARCTMPGTPGQRERCHQRLRERLMSTAGVRHVNVRCGNAPTGATVEFDYDARLVPLQQIEAELTQAGACLCTAAQAQVTLGIDGMASPRSEQAIESALAKLPGVTASASFASRSLRVEFDRTQCALPEIARRLDQLGFRLREGGPIKSPEPQRPGLPVRIVSFFDQHRELGNAIIGAIFLVLATAIHLTDGPPILRYVFVSISFLTAGWFTAIDTLRILRRVQFDIDVLMFAAAIGAALLGHFEEGALLLVLFALGGAGEELAMDRARNAIAALAKLAPDTATVRDAAGRDRLVRVEDLAVGDQVVIRPFDRVPADGVVVSGASAIDQSPITGESVPVEKVAGQPVFAGTINGEGLLVASVSRVATESTLARIVRMVEEAQTTKSPTQVFTDRVERWYVPLVLISTALLIVVPPLVAGGTGWATWFYRAMAFLTAASPCALAIGTPAAVLSGIARAARIGVLLKGGVHLENLGRVRAVAFDKTGTLTQGRPDVTDVVCLDAMPEDEILALAAAVEQASTHPLARAIVSEAQSRGIKPPSSGDAQQIPGHGVSATVSGRRVTAGRSELFAGVPSSNGTLAAAVERLSRAGRSTVVVAVDDVPVGVIGLADRARGSASDTIARLKALGIARTIMLTGDKRTVADAVGREVGVDEVYAELLPEQKLDLVRRLESRYGPIAMIGDGVNDAPALATATVGIAMGGAGTDVAIETADVALMADDLARLPDAIALSRFSRRIITQNLIIALGVIALLAPTAALGFAPLGIAVLFHEGSTVVVVLNALRLLMYTPR